MYIYIYTHTHETTRLQQSSRNREARLRLHMACLVGHLHEGSALSLVASSSARPLGAVFIGSVAGMLTMGCFSQLGERPTNSDGSLQVFGRCVGCPACAGPRLKR